MTTGTRRLFSVKGRLFSVRGCAVVRYLWGTARVSALLHDNSHGRFEPAYEQLVSSHHQSGQIIMAPVTDDEPTMIPMADNRRPRGAITDAQQAPILLLDRLGAHGHTKAEAS
jgi:HD superfamily phosphohydrolase